MAMPVMAGDSDGYHWWVNRNGLDRAGGRNTLVHGNSHFHRRKQCCVFKTYRDALRMHEDLFEYGCPEIAGMTQCPFIDIGFIISLSPVSSWRAGAVPVNDADSCSRSSELKS
jgi:hypothetical protein